jgi:hypothetical protein
MRRAADVSAPRAPDLRHPAGAPPLAAISAGLRRALRLLTSDLEAEPPLLAAPVEAPAAGETSALLVSPGGDRFRPPGGQWIDLGKRRTLRLILKALVELRERAPGRAMPLAALLAIGWPGERMGHEAGRDRVYTALSRLKNLGLEKALLRRDDGYLLAPEIPLRVVGG